MTISPVVKREWRIIVVFGLLMLIWFAGQILMALSVMADPYAEDPERWPIAQVGRVDERRAEGGGTEHLSAQSWPVVQDGAARPRTSDLRSSARPKA